MKRTIKLLLIFLGYQLLTFLPFGIALVLRLFDYSSSFSGIHFTSISIALLASSILTIWHLIHFGYVKVNKKSFFAISYKVVLESLIIGFTAIILLGWLSSVIDLPDLMSDMFSGLGKNIFGFLVICLVGPIAEEFVFRGGIEGYLLKRGRNPRIAIFVSALIFGLIHGNPAQILFAFLIGLLLGWLYYRSGSLLLVILIHVANNTLSTVLSLMYIGDVTLVDITGEGSLYIVLGGSLICFILSFWRLNEMLPKPVYQIETDNDIK